MGRSVVECGDCGLWREANGRGLCGSCWARHRRLGTLEQWGRSRARASQLLQDVLALPLEGEGCVLWQGALSSAGYAVAGHTYVHRAQLARVVGRDLGEGEVTRHRCRERACVAPWHLEVGSYRENNVGDRKRDGTYPEGEAHGRARLTAEQVRHIRVEVAAGRPQVELARELGVSQPTVSDVVTGRTWSHLG